MSIFNRVNNFIQDHSFDESIKWIKQRLKESSTFFPKIEEPKVAMTLLVKNEADIIRENILFHKQMGIDYILVTDNGSTDGTIVILEKLLSSGVIDYLKIDGTKGFKQDELVDSMIHEAQKNYNPDWIINSDADEFWYSANLKKLFHPAGKTLSDVNGRLCTPTRTIFFYPNM